MEKPDCFKCRYMRKNPGSAHIRCGHPSNKKLLEDSMLNLLALFATGSKLPISYAPKELKIEADQGAINSGWFNYPWDFDPIWLKNCEGYKEVDKDE